MRTLRLYYPNLSAKRPGHKFALYDQMDIKHLKVLRAEAGGYEFEVGDGLGRLGRASLLQLTKEGVLFKLDQLIEIAAPTAIHTLVIPIIRPTNLEIAIDQAVQFDLYNQIWLYFPDFSRLSKQELSANKLKRMQKIALEAFKQSHALVIPQIELGGKLEDVLGKLEVEQCLVPDLNNSKVAATDIMKLPKAKTALVIGPEGGFSPSERQLLNQASKPLTWQLGHTILTTEASVTAFSALLSAAYS